MDERTITEGTRIYYKGKGWSPRYKVTNDLDGIYVALDGVDTTERGSSLLVVSETLWEESVDDGQAYLITDLEAIDLDPPPTYWIAYHASHERDENWATVHGPFDTKKEASAAAASMARDELLMYHEDEPGYSDEERVEDAAERERISGLSDDDVFNEYNNTSEVGTFGVGHLYKWKES